MRYHIIRVMLVVVAFVSTVQYSPSNTGNQDEGGRVGRERGRKAGSNRTEGGRKQAGGGSQSVWLAGRQAGVRFYSYKGIRYR